MHEGFCCIAVVTDTAAVSMHSTDWSNRALLPEKLLHQLCCACPDGLNEQKQKKRRAYFAAGASGKTACMKAVAALLL